MAVSVTDAAGASYTNTVTIAVENVAPVLYGNRFANTLSGTGEEDAIYGGRGNDRLSGFEGDDLLVGGSGADTMLGGEGNDTYQVGSSLDVVIENEDEGIDHVMSSISYRLGENLENLTLTGNAANGTGNALANQITGNDGDNRLSGGGGDDILIGNGGDDILNGGQGNDRFVFGEGFGNDTIRGFDARPAGGQDLLDISAFGITADIFAIEVDIIDLGSDTLVQIGTNSILLAGVSGAGANTITQDDFVLA